MHPAVSHSHRANLAKPADAVRCNTTRRCIRTQRLAVSTSKSAEINQKEYKRGKGSNQKHKNIEYKTNHTQGTYSEEYFAHDMLQLVFA